MRYEQGHDHESRRGDRHHDGMVVPANRTDPVRLVSEPNPGRNRLIRISVDNNLSAVSDRAFFGIAAPVAHRVGVHAVLLFFEV